MLKISGINSSIQFHLKFDQADDWSDDYSIVQIISAPTVVHEFQIYVILK